jgi:hypothetical protein
MRKSTLSLLLTNGAPAVIAETQTTFTTFIVLTDSPAQAKAAHNNPRSSKLRVTLDDRHDISIH